jgi:hypothetical protein
MTRSLNISWCAVALQASLVVSLVASLAGCADEATGSPDAGMTDDLTLESAEACADVELDDPDDIDKVYQIGRTLGPSQEVDICLLMKAPKDDLWINSTEVKLAVGSHHGLLYKTSYEELPETDLKGDPIKLNQIVPCEAGAGALFEVTSVIAGSQGRVNASERGVMPDNVATKLPGGSYVVAELHMLNTQDEPLTACMKIGLRGIPEEQVEHEAGLFFFYNPWITLAPGESGAARMACPITQDISLKTAVSHMHSRGVGYEAKWLDGDPFDPDTLMQEMLYTTERWDDPEDQVFEEPLQLQAGDFIDYTCTYQNDSEDIIAQGLETTDEMCMFVGIYWPVDLAMSNCSRPDSARGLGGAGGYQIGTGTMDGDAFSSCIRTADFAGGAAQTCGKSECTNYEARYAFQSCYTNACPALGKYTRPYTNCIFDNSSACREGCDEAALEANPSCVLDCLHEDMCATELANLTETPCE